MRFRKFASFTFLVVILFSWQDSAVASHPIIIGFERFHSAGNADVASAGDLLLTELNCVACHRGDSKHAKQAPVLDQVSARVKPRYLAEYLANPSQMKPGTTMPNLFAGQTPAEAKPQIEALVHYLVSLGPAAPPQQFPTMGAAEVGSALYHSVGCAVCHGDRREGAKALATDKPMGNVMSKYTLPTLADFIRDPLHVRPSGRMPDLNLSASEATSIASFLLKGLPEVARIQYSYYEGSWQQMPDFSVLKPMITAATDRIDVSMRKRNDNFGLRFEGFLNVADEGDYRFHLGSDDGSRLTIDGKVVIDHNGVHGYGVKSAGIRLAKGFHSVVVEFFEAQGEERLSLEYEGPGVKRQPVANSMSHVKAPPKSEDLDFTVDSQLADRGRQLFRSLGCASCHAVHENKQRVSSTLSAGALASVNPSRGCLSETPVRPAVNFSLNARQRRVLAAAVKRRDPTKRADPSIHDTMVRFNCYACHARDKVGGVVTEHNSLFSTTIKEMGDEGRIPPDLTGVGGKLTDKWLDGILENGGSDRPYMLTRMPKFGTVNVGYARSHFVKNDQLEALPKLEFGESLSKVKAHGRRLVGSRGFSCIKCHTFGQYKATGIQSIDMKTMTSRLREEWFRTYIRNPQLFRPGTRMPSAWPLDRSLLPKILDGSSKKQIAAVWEFLSDGKRAKLPDGLVTGSMELIPADEAVIYRNFIKGAGSRAIGVGYPEGVNLAFDANESRYALIWQGRFIDASMHWSGRGQGFQSPLGENVISLSAGVPFAVLNDDKQTWPSEPARDQGYRFEGYRLTDDQRPTFLYRYGQVQVQDYVDTTGEGDEAPMKRLITLQAKDAPANIWMRAAVAGKITKTADGQFLIDDRLQMRIQHAGASPVIRRVGSNSEIVLPIRFRQGQAKIEQSYLW